MTKAKQSIDFDAIYQKEVIEALEKDTELNLKLSANGKYLQGTCPRCNKKEVFISIANPYRLMCNRQKECQYEENTYDRYSYLFENLSERFPATEENPNASADAYMTRQRGFPFEKVKGLYKQVTKKLKDKVTLAEVVQFNVANGTWYRIIDENKIPFNNGNKADIAYGTSYKGLGWIYPNTVFNNSDTVYIVEGIFHAIALTLMGYKAIAAISSNNLPWDIIEAEKDKGIIWRIAFDNDAAGIKAALKYHKQLSEIHKFVQIALPEVGKDWDDVYREGKLTGEYIEKSLYRGNLLTARNKEWKAYYIFKETNKTSFLVDFKNYLYTVRVNTTEYYKATEKTEEAEDTFNAFLRCATIKQDCNCVPEFEYIQRDPINGEQQYYFSFKFPNPAQNCTEPLAPNALSNARAFRQALLDKTPGGNFEGNDKTLGILSSEWLTNVMTVKALPYVGYDEETGVYCFQEFGFKDGQHLKVNSHNFIKVANVGIKTKLKKPHILACTKEFNTDWIQDYYRVHSLNGLALLTWWTASLFTQQIKKRQGSWHFLEFTGDAGAGKSSLIRWLWALFGRPNIEGTNPNKNSTSEVALRRIMSQLSNMPIVLIESDTQTKNSQGKQVIEQYNWDSIKDLFDYNGILKASGVKSNDNETTELLYRGSICIAQNNSIEASEAILTRIVHLHATTGHHSDEAKEIVEQLKNFDYEFLAGYMQHVLTHETQWLTAYFDNFKKYEKALLGVKEIVHRRIVLNHAQLMAAAKATQSILFPQWTKEMLFALINHLKDRAIDRQGRISKEPELLTKFWGVFRYLDTKVQYISDLKSEHEELLENRLNHSSDPEKEIAINIPHMTQIARSHGQYFDDDIHKLFPRSTTYKFKEYKKIRSKLQKGRSLWCWIFEKRANDDN